MFADPIGAFAHGMEGFDAGYGKSCLGTSRSQGSQIPYAASMEVSRRPAGREWSARLRRRWGGLACAAQILWLCALFVPSAANGALLTVDSILDESDLVLGAGGCSTVGDACTLRAAIEEANLNPDRDKIDFDPSVFDGGVAGTIALATELPMIGGPVTIADLCPPNMYNEVARRPCVGVDAEGNASGFRVGADEVAIEGIAVTGAAIGIDVIRSSDDFVARRDWIGADLAGGSDPNATGILLGPGANDARIGGYVAGTAGGNKIVYNNAVGLDLDGASRSEVVGNDFGLVGHSTAPNGKDIEITDHSDGGGSVVKAVANEVGSEIFGFGELSTYCDEGCNVISGAAYAGIDLQGDGGSELPASGPTTILGNFIGADASGEEAVPNGYSGIVVGNADRVTIGGSREKDGNLITGGLWGVIAGSESRELAIENNDVGRAADGLGVIGPPTQGALSVDSSGISYSEAVARIAANSIALDEGVAIENRGHGAIIVGNQIYGGDVGIHSFGENPWWFGEIDGNEVNSAAHFGILVESSKYRILGNAVFLAGKAGIRVGSPSVPPLSEVLIGGNDGVDENLIEFGGGPAVEIVGESSFVQVARNFGGANAGPFIDLGADGLGNQPDGPNGGIQAPSIGIANVNEVSGGSAEPGATIRVFLKTDPSPGGLEDFLASTQVQNDGRWSVTYPTPLPAGTPIAVSQTGFHGTSELTSASTHAADAAGGSPQPPLLSSSPKPGEAPCAHASGARCANRPRAPETRIVTGPRRRQRRTTATFRFVSLPSGSRMRCSLDGKPFRYCRSPKTYRDLRLGRHAFRVRAVGRSGLIDKSPAVRRFIVLRTNAKESHR